MSKARKPSLQYIKEEKAFLKKLIKFRKTRKNLSKGAKNRLTREIKFTKQIIINLIKERG